MNTKAAVRLAEALSSGAKVEEGPAGRGGQSGQVLQVFDDEAFRHPVLPLR